MNKICKAGDTQKNGTLSDHCIFCIRWMRENIGDFLYIRVCSLYTDIKKSNFSLTSK